MQRDVCDRCLAVNTSDEPFRHLDLSLGEFNASLDEIETGMSICPKCKPVVIGIITERIMLTETPDDVKRGTFFDKPVSHDVPDPDDTTFGDASWGPEDELSAPGHEE